MDAQELRLMAYREAWNVLGGNLTMEVEIWKEREDITTAPFVPSPEEVLAEARKIYSFLLGD